MATYKIKLKRRSEVASGTMAFHFEKPDGFTFEPGQCGDFTLPNPPQNDAEGNKRSFSIAAAPYENELFIATRMRDTAFKRSLKLIDLGTELDLEAPWGELTLHDDARIPAVFLTGGIGITPVRSIVLQAAHDKLAHPLFAFYSNRTPNDAAFLDELAAAQEANPNFTLIATMTEVNNAQWSGETGYITEAMLKKHLPDLSRPIYYLTGPPEMVAAMQKLLKNAGVKEANIRAEEFSGY
ncbi:MULTISPECIES: FAD-dependent oxidoreductase [Acidobacteriaceae]|uniref:FAD-dependent oxidoreductase n=1 Tax=Acidobacteriaceae TaxID=204434 RepID=UPI00131D37C0|nr:MULTISPECIES: FAD-dependent oxidoreductase [Acidobacteriaceae]MDW5266783.1 FAD-dependent oxidoreductase [Edaphobacter sp.]